MLSSAISIGVIGLQVCDLALKSISVRCLLGKARTIAFRASTSSKSYSSGRVVSQPEHLLIRLPCPFSRLVHFAAGIYTIISGGFTATEPTRFQSMPSMSTMRLA